MRGLLITAAVLMVAYFSADGGLGAVLRGDRMFLWIVWGVVAACYLAGSTICSARRKSD